MTDDTPSPSRLRAIYATYLGQVGLLATYLPWFFLAQGLTSRQIGLLMSARTAIAMVAQPMIMRESDRRRAIVPLLRVALVGCLFGAFALRHAAGPQAVVAVVIVHAVAAAGVIPLLDTASVRAVGDRRYASVRVWGSVGYGATVGLFGLAVSALSYEAAGGHAVDVMVLLVGVSALLALGVPLVRRPVDTVRPALGRIPITLGLAAFLAANALHWASVTVFNIFLALHVQELGLPAWAPGAAVAVAIVFEIGALQLAPGMLARAPARRWVLLAFGVSIARWIGTALVSGTAALTAWQALHFFSFGVWFAAAIEMLGRFAPPERRGTLQGIYSSAVLAGGGVLGGVAGGELIELYGSRGAFFGAAAFDVLAFVLFGVAIVARRRRLAREAAPDDDAA